MLYCNRKHLQLICSFMKLISLLFISLFGCASCATHWVVTDEGRIQAAQQQQQLPAGQTSYTVAVKTTDKFGAGTDANVFVQLQGTTGKSQGDSLFNMVKSHDLVQFMRQEERIKKAMVAQSDIDDKKYTIKRHEELDDPKIEEKIMETDCDCVVSGKPLTQHYLYTSSAIALESYGFHVDTFIGNARAVPKSSPILEPYCSKIFKLDFSMAAFEHLEGVRFRKNLTFVPENGLGAYLHSEWENSSDFGHFITLALKETPSSWVLHNLATFYWRIVGNAYEAMECVRRSMHLTPRRYVAVPLLNLANILHRSGRSVDAAVVLDVLINFNDSVAAGYCAAAEVYAVIGQYNASVAAFEACLLLDPNYPNAKTHMAAVLCHQKLESALESQHENLQQTLSELQSYQKRLKNYQTLHEKMLAPLIDPKEKERQSLIYDYFTYGQVEYSKCQWVAENSKTVLQCVVEDWTKYRRSRDKIHKQLFGKKRAELPEFSFRELKVGEEVDMMSKECPDDLPDTWNSGSNEKQDKDRDHIEALELYRGVLLNPNEGPKYPLKDTTHLTHNNYIFKDHNWPPKELCSGLKLPSFNSIPSIFITPENKGYQISELLTKFLGLSKGHSHPFPWYPPFCLSPLDQPNIHLPCCDHLLGVQRAKKRDKVLMTENDLKPDLLNLTGYVLDSEAEMGQRIHTLLKNGNGPKWLLYNLAALYWRVAGIPAESIACLRQALADQNSGHHDVALVQLAQLSMTAGERIDDAILLMKQAVEIDQNEPASHFLLGYFLAMNKNSTGAMHHMTETVQLDPLFPNALKLLKRLRCHTKYAPQEQNDDEIEVSLRCDEDNIPTFFCVKDLSGKEHCYMEEKMRAFNPCKTDNNCLSCAPNQLPKCVAPPSWASAVFLDGSTADRICSSRNTVSQRVSPEVEKCIKGGKTEEKPKKKKKIADGTATKNAQSGKKKEEMETITVKVENDDEEEIEEVTLDADNTNEVGILGQNSPPPSKTVVQYGVQKSEATFSPVTRSSVKKPTVSDAKIRFESIPVGEPSSSEVVSNDESLPKNTEPNIATLSAIRTNDDDDIRVFMDTPLPEVLPKPFPEQLKAGAKYVNSFPSSSAECAQIKKRVNLQFPTSTWLSVTAKGLKLDKFIDFSYPVPKDTNLEPICPDIESNSMWTMDHLYGYIKRNNLESYKPEKGLRDAFENLGNRKEPFEKVATRLTLAMRTSKTNPQMSDKQDGGVHWSLTTVAALYWRVKGDAVNAIKCIRHSLNNAPYHMRDLGLVSLANIYHQSGFYNSALIVGSSALLLSPRFVVIHFTLANVYAALGDLDHATEFYFSTLALQNNFEPARDRIKAIYCITGKLPDLLHSDLLLKSSN